MEVKIKTSEGPIGPSVVSEQMLGDMDRLREAVHAAFEEAANFLPGAPVPGRMDGLRRKVETVKSIMDALVSSASMMDALRRKAEKVEAEQGSDFD